jgi:8-amino-7-oxononanoate synthase
VLTSNSLQFDAGRASLVDLVRYRAQYQPDDVVFTYLTNNGATETSLTFSELDRRCRRVAAWLQRNDMRGRRALLLYRPGLEFIVGFYGCLYAGAAAIPAYPPTKNRSMLRIQSIAANAEASMALTTTEVIEQVKGTIADTPLLQQIPWLPTNSIPEGVEDDWVDPQVEQSEIAFLQYTSGSTGNPKGVMLSHGNMLNNSMLIERGFEHTRSSIGVYWLPSYHDMGLIGGVIQPVYCGCPIYMMAPLSFLTRPHLWLRAISKYRATTSGGPNFSYDLCVRMVKEEKIEGIDLSSWKVAFNGAEPVQAETLERFAAKFEPYGFKYESFYPCFGLAEGTLIVSGGLRDKPPVIRTVDSDALGAGRAVEVMPDSPRARRIVSSGRMIFGQRIVIVDTETLRECPDGHVGEIWTASPSVALGYWRNEEETKQNFHARLADKPDEGPFLRTGDLGFMENGELFVTGRIKDVMIIRGVNVYPQDIELTAQRVSPLLVQNSGGAFLIGEENDEKLVLVQEVERKFQPEQDAPPIFSEIRKRIALEHELPISAIVLIRKGSLPKTSSGKVQRHACREYFIANELKAVAKWSVEDEALAAAAESAQKTTGYLDEDNPLYASAEGSAVDEKNAALKQAKEDFSTIFTVVEKKPVESRPESAPKAPIPAAGLTFSYEETVRVVLEEVYRVAKERARNLTLDTDIPSLGLDSLERMEILAAIEDRFGGQFPEDVLPHLATARELVDGVHKYLAVGHGRAVGTKRYEIDETCYDFAKFPEYVETHQRFEMAKSLGMNHFFEPHEGTAGDTIRIGGKDYINFSTYNYIGTSGDPRVTKAAQDAVAQYGTTAGASRIVAGEIPLHRELENEITNFLGTEDTIVLVSGHQTNESVIGHLMGSEDLILHDSLAHNSIVQGCILSGARRRPFPHGDWQALDKILSDQRTKYRRVLVVLEGVYSMDGDYPDLPEFINVRNKYKTLLMVDEAHSIGVLGKTGRGIGEHFNIDRKDVDIWMCTLSKTFASCGGYISGRKELVEYLKYTAPAFMFSVGMPPAQAGAALAALRVLQDEPERAEKLRQNSAYFRKLAQEHGMNVGLANDTGVVPVIIGRSIKTLAASHQLFLRGINAHPILRPAVEESQARIRFFLTSMHSFEQIKTTLDTLAVVLKELDALS